MGAMFFGNALNWLSIDEILRGAFGMILGSFCIWASDFFRDKQVATATTGRMRGDG
jgi:hypothetical protein